MDAPPVIGDAKVRAMPGFDGATLRVWRRSRGWDVPEMARQLRTAARKAGVHVATHAGLIRMIYAWERGDHDLSERYELLYRKLGLAAPGDIPYSSMHKDAPRGEEERVRRHDFLGLAGVATVGLLTGGEWPGRQPVVRYGPVDEASVPALTDITGAQRRLEATTPARDLARGVMAHADTAHRVLLRAGDSPHAAGIAASLSEACGLAAWLHADMADAGTARACYRLAIQAAGLAGSNLLAGYMLGSVAAFEADAGVPAAGVRLIERARQQIGRSTHPTPVAWLHAVRALTLAGADGTGDAAWRSLGAAERVLSRSDGAGAPPWPWVFSFDYPKLAGYRALVAVRLGRPAEALAAFGESRPAGNPAPKQRAVLMLEVATATCQEGCAARDPGRVDDAFTLASGALTAGVEYSSDRVIERSWRFRRSYAGPVTSLVRSFDEQLHAAVA